MSCHHQIQVLKLAQYMQLFGKAFDRSNIGFFGSLLRGVHFLIFYKMLYRRDCDLGGCLEEVFSFLFQVVQV